MVGNPFLVKIIESTINKIIADIKDNPKRGIKNLINLGNRFTNNKDQKDLIQSLQGMLASPNSPYHEILPALVNHVNNRTLKTFIINLTYNSWSYGGRKIKQYKKAYDDNTPWAIVFDFTSKPNTSLSHDTIIAMIEEGKRLGVYTYLFFIDHIDDYSYILRQNPDCAFVLFVPPLSLTSQNISAINSYHNTFFSVLYEADSHMDEFKSACQLLYDHHSLFGSYCYYNDENIDYILKSQWTHDMLATGSPFLFLIESPGCSPAKASLIHDYVNDSNLNQKHPFFLMDLYEQINVFSK